MDKCYLCGDIFNDENVKKHEEHIIQQAIGGNLTVSNILCSSCGEKLGKEIDEPFNKIFEGISTRLDIKTDRKNGKKAIKGKMGPLDVIWKDFKTYPLRPFHVYSIDKKNIVIYASLKTAKKYRKKVEDEIKDNFHKNDKPNITICDDLEGVVEYPFNMDNRAFKKGLAKIAIGFACKNGIQRENLFLALEIDKNTKQGKIKNKILAIQFYPLAILDRLIEIQKNEFEHYPFHNLILFTLDYSPSIRDGKKVLICYIELFSTFQWYIILNDEYYGDSLYEYYAQQILKKDDYIIELGRRYYKERNIWLQSLGITEEYINKKYNNRKDNSKSRWDIEEKLIQEETIKQKYKFDFEGYIENSVGHICGQIFMQERERLPNKKLGNSHFYDLNNVESMMNFKKNVDLFFHQQHNEDSDDMFRISSYRRLFFKKNNLKNYYTELLKHYKALVKIGAYKKYGYCKMYMLGNYIQKESIKKKPNK